MPPDPAGGAVMRCVFHAMAGFLGRVDSETRCAFWAEEPVNHGVVSWPLPGRRDAAGAGATERAGYAAVRGNARS